MSEFFHVSNMSKIHFEILGGIESLRNLTVLLCEVWVHKTVNSNKYIYFVIITQPRQALMSSIVMLLFRCIKKLVVKNNL